jgi:hypothetical protein
MHARPKKGRLAEAASCRVVRPGRDGPQDGRDLERDGIQDGRAPGRDAPSNGRLPSRDGPQTRTRPRAGRTPERDGPQTRTGPRAGRTPEQDGPQSRTGPRAGRAPAQNVLRIPAAPAQNVLRIPAWLCFWPGDHEHNLPKIGHDAKNDRKHGTERGKALGAHVEGRRTQDGRAGQVGEGGADEHGPRPTLGWQRGWNGHQKIARAAEKNRTQDGTDPRTGRTPERDGPPSGTDPRAGRTSGWVRPQSSRAGSNHF